MAGSNFMIACQTSQVCLARCGLGAPKSDLIAHSLSRNSGTITLFAGRNDLHLHEDFRLDQLSNDLEHERRSNIA